MKRLQKKFIIIRRYTGHIFTKVKRKVRRATTFYITSRWPYHSNRSHSRFFIDTNNILRTKGKHYEWNENKNYKNTRMKTKNQRRKRQDISTSGGNQFSKTRSFRKLSQPIAISQHKLKSTLNRNLKTLIPSENRWLTITKFFVEKVPKFIFRFARIKLISASRLAHFSR